MKTCAVNECHRKHYGKGWCQLHYKRWRSHGSPELVRRLNGTGGVDTSGYMTTRGVRNHISIAEAALGHKLPPGAVVHHLDGDRLNNAPENLVVCPSQAYHMHLHAILREYKQPDTGAS